MIARRLTFALLCAVLISGAFTFWLSRRVSHARQTAGASVSYVALARDMEAGDILKAEDLKEISWPGNTPLPGAFHKPGEIVGRVLLYPAGAGQPVQDRQLSATGASAGLATRIPDGMRALSLKSDQVVGVAGFLSPGTHVDVLVTFHTANGAEPVTSTVLQDARILAAGQKLQPDPDGKPTTVDVVTLLVTPQDAEKAVLASTQGTVHFVLRNGDDRGQFDAKPTELSALGNVPDAPKLHAAPPAVHEHAALPVTVPVAIKKGYSVQVIRGDKQSVGELSMNEYIATHKRWTLLALCLTGTLLNTHVLDAQKTTRQSRKVAREEIERLAAAAAAADAAGGPGHFAPESASTGEAGKPGGLGSLAAPKPVQDDFMSATPSEKASRLVVGHSVFVTTRHRLSKVYVTDPAVLYAYTASPNQVLVTSRLAGISSVVVWDETGESQSYLFNCDVDIDALARAMQGGFPGEKIVVGADQGRVVLTGAVTTTAVSDGAAKLASLYAKDVSNALVVNSASRKQVKLKVRIVEVDRSKLDQFAFNFFSAGGKNLAATTTTQFPSTLTASASGSAAGGASGTTSTVGNNTVSISNPLNFLLYSSQLNVGATLQDLESRQVLQILAEPTITAVSGQKANFLAGGEFPFPVVQGTSGGLTSISVQFRPYGVKLEFTPVVNIDGSIQLSVSPEVSALDYTNAVTISGYTIPALSTRRAETEVVLRSGQSFAISGLLDNRTTDSLGRTPGISNIPILGKLFNSKSINHSRTELIVVVTPTIVDPLTEQGPIEDPVTALPFLNPKTFDANLPKVKPN